MAQHYDVPLKVLFRHSGDGVIRRLLFGARVVEYLATEQPQVTNLRADVVARTDDGAIHQVEFQTVNEADFGRRMLTYYVSLANHYRQHVVQTVLYAGREPLRMGPEYSTPSLEFRFDIVNLRELDAAPLLASDDWADLVLALLAKGDPKKALAAVLPKLARMQGEEREWAQGSLVLLSGILRLEELVTRQLKEAGMINALENKVIGPLILEAEEKGRMEGRVEGRVEGSQATLAGQLAEKFGPLPDWAMARLQAASSNDLQIWAKRVLKARTIEETFR